MDLGKYIKENYVRVILIAYIIVFLMGYTWKFGQYYQGFLQTVFIAGIILTLISPVFGVLIFISSLIYSKMYLMVPFTNFAITSLYDFVIIAAIIWILFFKEKSKEKRFDFSDILVWIILVLLTFLMLFNNIDFFDYSAHYINWLEGALVYFAISIICSKKERIWAVAWTVFLSYLMYVFHYYQFSKSFEESMWGFQNNDVSMQIAFVIPIIIYLFLTEKNKYLRWLCLIGLAFYFWDIVQLGARATWLTLGPVLILISLKNINKKGIWLLGICGIILVTFFAPPMAVDQFNSIFTEGMKGQQADDGSIAERAYLRQAGWELFQEKPIFGWGPGQFTPTLINVKNYVPKSSHNSYVEIMVEEGGIFLIFYVLLILCSIYYAYKAMRLSRKKDKMVHALSQAVMFGLIAGSTNNFFLAGPWIPILWIFMGMSIALLKIAENLPYISPEEEKKKAIAEVMEKQKLGLGTNKMLSLSLDLLITIFLILASLLFIKDILGF